MKLFTRILTGTLSTVLVFSLLGCGKSKSERPDLEAPVLQKEMTYIFSAQPSQMLSLSAEGAASVMETVTAQQPDYRYAQMYELDEVKRRLEMTGVGVEKHQFSVLNEAGTLNGEHLATVVEQNNKAFLEPKPFGYENVESDYILELCDFIANVVNRMAEKYPDIDWQRVYCNLGNLKILYDTGMLSYAQVKPDMVLAISKNNTQILLTLQGDDGFPRVLTHETMHIIQMGCACENIENCSRRAGIAYYWDDFTLNTTDWTWLAEGGAERNMCALTGGQALTYQYKIDYLCSFNMALLLRENVAADRMETLCFYDDPQLLFDAFGCETPEKYEEVLKLVITTNTLQMQPTAFMERYREETGVDLWEDEAAMDAFSFSMKPAICIGLAKEFYENLTAFVAENPISSNDLFCLIALFEGHLNQHLQYGNEAKKEYNQVFFDGYLPMRTALFQTLTVENPGADIDAMYAEYQISVAENTVNAELSMLLQSKRAFLLERAQWQAEMGELGEKVPVA